MSTGKLEHIWIKRAHDGPMEAKKKADLVSGQGLATNADQGGRRQVTLLDKARWAGVEEDLGIEVDPSARRANLMVSGVSLEETQDRILVIGETRLRINGETKPCQLMDQAYPGLREALVPHWGGGAYAEVLEGGLIRIGDPVSWDASN